MLVAVRGGAFAGVLQREQELIGPVHGDDVARPERTARRDDDLPGVAVTDDDRNLLEFLVAVPGGGTATLDYVVKYRWSPNED